MTSTVAVKPYVRDDSDPRPQVILNIDRSPVDIFENPDGSVGYKEVPGGAGKVVAGDAAALLREGFDVHVVAVAKTDFQRRLANEKRPFLYDYNGQIITYHFADIPEDIYKEARDGAFSDGVWWDQQEQDHPAIRPKTTRKQVDCYIEANRYVAAVDNYIARPGARIWDHDSHVGRVALELVQTFGRDDLDTGYVHHAAMHYRSYLERLFPDKKAVEALPLDDPQRCHYDLIRSVVVGFAAHDVVNFSSGGISLIDEDADGDLSTQADRGQDIHSGWALAGQQSFDFFGISRVDQQLISAVPVCLDAAYVAARAEDPKVEEIRFALAAELGSRKLVIAGGRAEPYKQLQLFIQSERMRYSAMAPSGGYGKDNAPPELTALLTSPTREHVGFYRKHYDKEVVGEAKQVNHLLNMAHNPEYASAYKRKSAFLTQHAHIRGKLRQSILDGVMRTHGVEFIRIVDGNKYENTLAYQIEADVNVTLAQHEGYNLMAIEQPVVQAAARRKGITNKVCVHVMNTAMGLSHHLETLDRSGVTEIPSQAQDVARARKPAAMYVTARVVRVSNLERVRSVESEIRDREIMAIAATTQQAIRLPRRQRLEMFEELLRVPMEQTPTLHTKLLNRAGDRGISRRSKRIADKAIGTGEISPSDHAYLGRHGGLCLIGENDSSSISGFRNREPARTNDMSGKELRTTAASVDVLTMAGNDSPEGRMSKEL